MQDLLRATHGVHRLWGTVTGDRAGYLPSEDSGSGASSSVCSRVPRDYPGIPGHCGPVCQLLHGSSQEPCDGSKQGAEALGWRAAGGHTASEHQGCDIFDLTDGRPDTRRRVDLLCLLWRRDWSVQPPWAAAAPAHVCPWPHCAVDGELLSRPAASSLFHGKDARSTGSWGIYFDFQNLPRMLYSTLFARNYPEFSSPVLVLLYGKKPQ